MSEDFESNISNGHRAIVGADIPTALFVERNNSHFLPPFWHLMGGENFLYEGAEGCGGGGSSGLEHFSCEATLVCGTVGLDRLDGICDLLEGDRGEVLGR